MTNNAKKDGGVIVIEESREEGDHVGEDLLKDRRDVRGKKKGMGEEVEQGRGKMLSIMRGVV